MGDRGGYRRKRQKKAQRNNEVEEKIDKQGHGDNKYGPNKRRYRHGFDEYYKM